MNPRLFHNGKVQLYAGNCMEVLSRLSDDSIDAVVTDPPYHLTSIVKRFGGANAAPAKGNDAFIRASKGFMGKVWDGGDIAFRPELWAEVLRVLKPGGHMVCFGGTRTYHRMVCAIEDAGFEIRDQLAWVYGSGFPKSKNVALFIDKLQGYGNRGHCIATASRYDPDGTFEPNGEVLPAYEAKSEDSAPWQGWGTALKPAWEPICLARKPLSESTVAGNVLKWGTGALNIDGCRIETNDEIKPVFGGRKDEAHGSKYGHSDDYLSRVSPLGRWPANLCHDGSPEVLAGFPDAVGAVSNGRSGAPNLSYSSALGAQPQAPGYADSGSAARFFYTSKADADDRLNSKHPTVKPVDLMQWLVRLVCPKQVYFCFQCDEENHAKITKQSTQTAPEQAMRGMRECVSKCEQATEPGDPLLREGLCRPVVGSEQKKQEGFSVNEKGLQAGLFSSSSTCEASGRVSIRASSGDGTPRRPTSNEERGSTSSERHQNGQSHRESSIDEESRARRFELATTEHVNLSALLGKNCYQPPCPNCGELQMLRRGRTLDPFAGTGTTGAAAFIEGRRAVLIEREAEYLADIERRMELLLSGPDERSWKLAKPESLEALPLFALTKPAA